MKFFEEKINEYFEVENVMKFPAMMWKDFLGDTIYGYEVLTMRLVYGKNVCVAKQLQWLLADSRISAEARLRKMHLEAVEENEERIRRTVGNEIVGYSFVFYSEKKISELV